jgi:hypothetical protein
VGDADVIDYVRHTARSLIFSASMPPAQVAAVRAALQIIKEEPERTERVMQIGERMRQGYKELGFEVGDSQTPIVPVFIRDDLKTFGFWKALFEAGIYVNPIVPPAVPPEASLLRTSYMATHTDQQLDRVLDTFWPRGQATGHHLARSEHQRRSLQRQLQRADRPHRPYNSSRGQLLDGRQQSIGMPPQSLPRRRDGRQQRLEFLPWNAHQPEQVTTLGRARQTRPVGDDGQRGGSQAARPGRVGWR